MIKKILCDCQDWLTAKEYETCLGKKKKGKVKLSSIK